MGEAQEFLNQMIEKRTGLFNCARCGGSHETLDWVRFNEPAPSRDGTYTAWAMCPQMGAPILFEQVEVP